MNVAQVSLFKSLNAHCVNPRTPFSHLGMFVSQIFFFIFSFTMLLQEMARPPVNALHHNDIILLAISSCLEW